MVARKPESGSQGLYTRDSDIVLLDCPLAAVDSHVGDHIFKKCILGHLSNRCRLFATNQTHRLHCADKIILLENGKVVAYGGYDELKSGNDKFKQLLNDNQEGKATHSDKSVESDKTNNDEIGSTSVGVEILGTRASKSDSITTPGRNSAKDIIVEESVMSAMYRARFGITFSNQLGTSKQQCLLPLVVLLLIFKHLTHLF